MITPERCAERQICDGCGKDSRHCVWFLPEPSCDVAKGEVILCQECVRALARLTGASGMIYL